MCFDLILQCVWLLQSFYSNTRMCFDPILRYLLLQYQNVFCSNTRICFDPILRCVLILECSFLQYWNMLWSKTTMCFAEIIECLLLHTWMCFDPIVRFSIHECILLQYWNVFWTHTMCFTPILNSTGKSWLFHFLLFWKLLNF